jgi:uncharacterized membrane protein
MNERTKNVAFLGLMLAVMLMLMALSAVVAIFTLVAIAFPLIPVYVAAQTKGIKMGMILGTAYGLITFVGSYIFPTDLLFFAWQNPLVSVVPRFFVGLVAAVSFAGFKKLFSHIKLKKTPSVLLSSHLASLCATITNAVLVLGVMLLFYNNRTLEQGIVLNVSYVFVSIVLINTTAELIVLPIVTAPTVYAISKMVGIKTTRGDVRCEMGDVSREDNETETD